MPIHALVRGYLIDPQTKTIKRVSFDDRSHLTNMYRLMDCDCVDVVRLPDNTDCWIDDEGLFKQTQHFFALDIGFAGRPDGRIYVGKALILGCAGSETVSATIREPELLRRVVFLEDNTGRNGRRAVSIDD